MTRRPYLGTYIGAVALAAAALIAVTWGRMAQAGATEFVWAAVLAFTTYLGAKFGLHIGPKTKLEISTCSHFAAALLLPAPLAAIVGAVGAAAAGVHNKNRWYNTVFNVAETAVTVALGSIVFTLFHIGTLLRVDTQLMLLTQAVAASALVMYASNITLVSGVVAIRRKMHMFQVWRINAVEHLGAESALFSLGLVAALLARDTPWAVPMLIVPGVTVYVALKDRMEKMILAEKLAQQMEELKQTQAQLVQSARLSSVGTLAAGVAHEINNPIFIIGGNAELLLMDPGRHFRTEKAQEAVRTMQLMAERVAQIVGSLLTFSRTKQAQERLSINECADHVLNLVKYSLNQRSITVQQNYSGNLPPVSGRMGEIEQVMMNLVTNARDAMPHGGTLTITTALDGQWVRASFHDTGTGIPNDIRQSVFDPFFTTKEPGKGTGLGLYLSRRIMSDHHGEIRLEAPNGGGATFSLLFPVAPAAETETTAPRSDSLARVR